MEDYKNILVVRTDRIGDVVLTNPAIEVLKKAYPKAKVSLLVSPSTQVLVEDDPHLDELIVDDRKKVHKGLGGFIQLALGLRSRKFDLAIIYHTKRRTNLLCFLAGIPMRVGYKNNKFGFLLTQPLFDDRNKGRKHETQYCLDVLRVLGIPMDFFKEELDETDLFVSVNEASEMMIDRFFKQNNITTTDRLVAIHAGASDPAKRWPEVFFADIIEKLFDQYGTKIVLIGDADTRGISREIFSLTKQPVFDLTGMITLSELVSLLKRCYILISNDSGPVHVAASLNTPVISIFTRNEPGINPTRWCPINKKSRVISVAPDKLEAYKKKKVVNFSKAHKPDPDYLKLIPPQDVLEAVDSLFKLC